MDTMDTMETVETCAAQNKKQLKRELQTVFNTKEKMEPGGERKTSPQKTADPGQKRRKLLFYRKRQTIKRTKETSEKSDTSGIGFLKPEFEGPRVVGHTPYPQKVSLTEFHCGQSIDKLEQYNAPLKDQTPASTSVTFTHRPPVITALSQAHHIPHYLPSISNYSRFTHNLPVIDAAHSQAHRGLYHNTSGSLPLSTNYSTFTYNPLLGSAHTHVAPGSSSTSSTPDFNLVSIAQSYPLSTSIATFSQPQQDVDLSAYKPEKKKRESSLSHSQSSASSTSDSTVSHGVQSRLLDALNRSLSRSDSYQNSFHGQETKQTETEAAETAETEEGLRPIQRFLVTEDVQNEQRSQKFSPEGNIGIFSNPIRPALIWPHNTQLLQQDRELKMFNQSANFSACKLEGRRRAHYPPSLKGLHPSPTGLNTCNHYIQPQGYSEGGSILPLSRMPSLPCNVELRSPLSSFPESSFLNFNDPFQHLMLKEIKTEKINVPGSNEESDPEPNISHSRPSVTALPFCSQSSIPTVNGPPECSNEERLEEADIRYFVLQAEDTPDQNVTGAAPSPVRAEYESATNTPPPSSHLQVSSSCCLTLSHSAPSLSQTPKSNFRRAASLADMKLKEFTPAISAADGEDETYSFLCSCPGLYQCSVSGLVFSMKGEGDVVYRTVPWDRRLLAQHHKKPAGPLFDIQCLQQSVCQLHLPHCEIISTGGGPSLQVAHINDDVIEFISPHQVTETHVVLNISGFSAYGNIKDEDSPPDPVRALLLLFYKPPEDPDLRSVLSVLLLPRNIVIRDVQRTRRKLIGEERYLDTSPHCKLHPKQVYTLSTSPEDDLIKVQPKETEFDDEHHQSYFPSFQVVLKRILTDVNLTLRDSSSSSCVWEREVCLLPCGVKTLVTGPNRRPSDLRSSFVRRISGPVLSSLLDQLLDKRVITDAEREAADAEQSRRDRARLVFDTVSNKGEAARSEMMEFLCEEDPFLCEHLGLKAS